jgi:hypothetical protein
MSKTRKLTVLAAAGMAAMLLAGCETTDMKMGSQDAKTVATGSAAGSTTSGENSALEKCASPLGTVSLVENQTAGWYTVLTGEYKLPPTANLLRLLVQQSNCFVVLDRSAAGMRAMDRERDLQSSGQMRGGSHFGKGQMVASDYALSPEIVFSAEDAGGIGGVLGGLLGGGRRGQVAAAIGGSLQTKQASAMLTLVDNRSGVQVAASEGSASKTDLNLFGGLVGRNGGAGLGGYTNTPQGKVIAAAFMDAFNQMVVSLRGYQAQRVEGQGLGGGGRLGVDGGAAPSRTYVPGQGGSAALRQAQQRLNEKGYDAGTPDGGMGPRTASALRAFQTDSGLPVTGKLDAATSEALAK